MKKVMQLISMFLLILFLQSGLAIQQYTQQVSITKTLKVKGHVKNSVTQKPVQSAIVMIVGTSTGTITDDKGNFVINVPQGAKQLSFSADEYIPVRAAIDTSKEMSISLMPKNK